MDYVLSEAARCPRGLGEVMEKTSRVGVEAGKVSDSGASVVTRVGDSIVSN